MIKDRVRTRPMQPVLMSEAEKGQRGQLETFDDDGVERGALQRLVRS